MPKESIEKLSGGITKEEKRWMVDTIVAQIDLCIAMCFRERDYLGAANWQLKKALFLKDTLGLTTKHE